MARNKFIGIVAICTVLILLLSQFYFRTSINTATASEIEGIPSAEPAGGIEPGENATENNGETEQQDNNSIDAGQQEVLPEETPHGNVDPEQPTETPTTVPTETPTTIPTETPTTIPTEQPTTTPTEQPTVAPTQVPVNPKKEGKAIDLPVDTNPLKQAFIDAYYRIYGKNSYLYYTDEQLKTLVGGLTDRIVDQKLYPQATLDLLTNDVVKPNYYGVFFLSDTFYNLLSEKYPTTAPEKFVPEGTKAVSTDVNTGNYTAPKTGSKNDNSIGGGYVKNMTKEARLETTSIGGENVPKFRQYEVTMGLDVLAKPEASQVGNADIVILMDRSASMKDNFANEKAAATKIVDSLITPNYNVNDPSAVKIGVIPFSSSTSTPIDLSSDRDTLISKIQAINISSVNTANDNGASGTNIQQAILAAKDMLKINDSSTEVSDDRKKIIILLTDGVVTTRTTDQWNIGNRIFTGSSIELQEGNYAQSKAKRWSFLSKFGWSEGTPDPERISLPDGTSFIAQNENISLEGIYLPQIEFSRNITALEGQFAVSQGVELYTVGYTDNDNARSLLSNMTKGLNSIPSFAASGSDKMEMFQYNPMSEFDVVERSDQYTYNAGEVNQLIHRISYNLKVEVENQFKPYTISDNLNNAFELVGDITVSQEPYGKNPIDSSKWTKTVTSTGIQLGIPEDAPGGLYYVTYKMKVKPGTTYPFGESYMFGANKELYGSKAADVVAVSQNASLKFTTSLGVDYNLPFAEAKVSIQPNLQVDFKSDQEAVFTGETIKYTPTIISGSGYYNYKLSRTAGTQTTIPAQQTKLKPASNYNIQLPEQTETYTKTDVVTYRLEVEDIISGQKKQMDLKTAIKEPKLTIQVLDENGNTALPGAFETKVTTQKDGVLGEYYLSGLFKNVFQQKNAPTVLIRGTDVNVATYVPFGYQIKSIQDSDGNLTDGKVRFDMVRNTNGDYTGYEQIITIKVGQNPVAKYFYDWSWVVNNVIGSIPKAN